MQIKTKNIFLIFQIKNSIGRDELDRNVHFRRSSTFSHRWSDVASHKPSYTALGYLKT